MDGTGKTPAVGQPAEIQGYGSGSTNPSGKQYLADAVDVMREVSRRYDDLNDAVGREFINLDERLS